MIKIVLSTLFTCLSIFQISAQDAETVVQANLDAYNNLDIDTFMSYIADDVEMYNLGECEPYLQGKEKVRERYQTYFERSPELHSEIRKRIIFDNKVIDHELITGANGNKEPFELIFMYEVRDGLIVKTTAIRKGK